MKTATALSESPPVDVVVSAPVAKMNPHKAMQDYIKLRETRAELAKKDKVLKAAQDKIAQALLAMSKEQDVTGFKGEDCLCYQQEKRLYSVKDASAFFGWVLEYGKIDALHKRVNSDFASVYMEENGGELPPGIHVEKELAMHVRTVNEKD